MHALMTWSAVLQLSVLLLSGTCTRKVGYAVWRVLLNAKQKTWQCSHAQSTVGPIQHELIKYSCQQHIKGCRRFI